MTMFIRRCRRCGTTNRWRAKYCRWCGVRKGSAAERQKRQPILIKPCKELPPALELDNDPVRIKLPGMDEPITAYLREYSVNAGLDGTTRITIALEGTEGRVAVETYDADFLARHGEPSVVDEPVPL